MGIASGMREITQAIVSSHEERTKRVEEAKKEAQGLIEDFQTSRKQMGSELRKELREGVNNRKSEVKTLLGDFQSSRREMGAELRKDLAQDRTDRKSEVEKARAEVKADLKEARDAWQEVVSKRKVKAAPEAEEVPDWEAKLLAAVNEHPSGIALAEVAKSLGVAPVVLGRVARSLLDKGKIRKEEKLYLPVREEG